MKKNKTEKLFKNSIFGETLKPLKDFSTLATMEFNSNSKASKFQIIDKILYNHPKKLFKEYN